MTSEVFRQPRSHFKFSGKLQKQFSVHWKGLSNRDNLKFRFNSEICYWILIPKGYLLMNHDLSTKKSRVVYNGYKENCMSFTSHGHTKLCIPDDENVSSGLNVSTK